MRRIWLLFLVAVLVFSVLSCESTDPAVPAASTTASDTAVKKNETLSQAEYNRSVGALAGSGITKAVVAEDKQNIMKIIESLGTIMRNKNYGAWRRYLTPESIAYWENVRNLDAISKKLPGGNFKLTTMEDYFRVVFIPSRFGITVDEIRYISPTVIQAVQVTGQQDVIYYSFQRVNGYWLLHLDRL